MVPPKETSIKRRKMAIAKVEKTFDVISSRKRFPKATFHLFEVLSGAAKRGVRIRILTEKPVEDDIFPIELDNLRRNTFFDVRYSAAPPKALVNIFDSKEASITTSETASWDQSPSLWTNNPSLIAIIQEHFETEWGKSTQE